ncbi:MAG: helix-turn-helix domain-containing protein [Armatimonadota bacterium]
MDRVALPFCHINLTAQKPVSAAYPLELKTIGDHLRKHRLDLELFQRDVAERLGADTTSVYNWENNIKSPAIRFIPRIIRFLGHSPYEIMSTTATLGEKIVSYRQLHGISQEFFARQLKVDPGTLGRWEKNKSIPPMRFLNEINLFI